MGYVYEWVMDEVVLAYGACSVADLARRGTFDWDFWVFLSTIEGLLHSRSMFGRLSGLYEYWEAPILRLSLFGRSFLVIEAGGIMEYFDGMGWEVLLGGGLFLAISL